MKPQHLLASVAALSTKVSLSEAFSAAGSSSFTSSPRFASARRSRPSDLSSLRMDCEHDAIDAKALSQLEERISSIISSPDTNKKNVRPLVFSPGRSPRSPIPMDEASAVCGMPWTTTIGRSEEDDPLLYMPFWEWQMDYMQSTLTNLHPIECSTVNNLDVTYNENKDKRARIVNHCYASDEYRKIRMTYYDAGDSVQVFNSVWYPDAKYNLPVLGIDLLSFNRKKYLAIVDFQPIHEEEDEHALTYEHILKPIKDKYSSLKGRMSTKFYDETQFFSKEMLFARFEDGKIVGKDLFPAFKSYVSTHVDLVKSTPAATTMDDVELIFNRQRAYDTYSAERDPAAGLFAAMFGKEWAEDFIYDFLFSLSERKEDGLNLSPPMFGGPPQSSASARPNGQGERPQYSSQAKPVSTAK